MRTSFLNMIEAALTTHRNNPRFASAQLEYLAAKALLDTVRSQAAEEYMKVEGVSDAEMLEKRAEHDVAVDERYGVYEAEEYYKGKRASLIAWSQGVSVKIAQRQGMPEIEIQKIIDLHQNADSNLLVRQKLIDAALNLDAQTIQV